MVQQAIKSYKHLLDERLENSTFLVLVISWMIVLVWAFIPHAYATEFTKSSAFESSQRGETENTVLINGEEYMIYISKK